MSLRKGAGLLVALGLAVGLIGNGVGAQFTDHVTAPDNINVGTFGCIISNTTAGTIAPDGKSVVYNAADITSSAAGSAPFTFTVESSGSIPVVLWVSQTTPAAPFTSILAAPVPNVTLTQNQTHDYAAGLQWPELTNADRGMSVTITYSVNCVEVGATLYTLSGKFTAGGVDQSDGTVYLFDGTTYIYLGSAPVDGSGNYDFGYLPEGSYKLFLAPSSPGYGLQWYGGADFGSATPISLTSNTTVNITLAAPPTLYTLSGKFTAGGVDQSDGTVYLFDGTTYIYLGSAPVDGSGNYDFGYLPEGSYKLFLAPSSPGYGLQWYGGADFGSATPISLTSNTTVNITLAAPPTLYTLSGKFTAGGVDQSDGTVYLFDGTTYIYRGSAPVDDSGNYSFSNLPAGLYKVFLAPSSPGYGLQWYGGADFGSATTFNLSSNSTLNIDL